MRDNIRTRFFPLHRRKSLADRPLHDRPVVQKGRVLARENRFPEIRAKTPPRFREFPEENPERTPEFCNFRAQKRRENSHARKGLRERG
jgi:hypothetical protein